MQPNSEPTPTDVQIVQAAMDGTPQPAPQPQPQTPAPEPAQQPQPVTPQPAPSQQPTDPMASLFASEPGQPTEPPTPQPQQPTEPVQPAPQAPAQMPAPVDEAPTFETYDEYIARVTAGVPVVPDQPDPSKINPDDPEAIKGFFDELINTAVTKAQAETQKSTAIQTAERRAWDEAFEFSPTLKSNKKLRDIVHNIRVANFQRGVALTPIQAAQQLLEISGASYNKGVADNQVITTYEAVQPNGGGSGTPIETSLDKDSTIKAVQDGGESALAGILDREIKAGRTW